ncbi:MAG: urea carboxylase-associated family protein [Burkholderiaceae bacterium]
MTTRETLVPAGHGKGFRLASGEQVRIGLAEGPQVADMFAFALPELGEYLSTAHTRSCVQRLTPVVGEAFYSNRRRPMLAFESDTSPGRHDLLLSACDQMRYTLLGHAAPHRNCVANTVEALAELGLKPPAIPSPVNLFENVAIGPDGALVIEAPIAKRGDSVTLRALMDLVLVISACPMDIVPTNGADLRPKTIFVEQVSTQ